MPAATRTIVGSLWRKAMRPSGSPATLPAARRSSKAGSIARRSPGSTVSDSAVAMMMTSCTACAGATNMR